MHYSYYSTSVKLLLVVTVADSNKHIREWIAPYVSGKYKDINQDYGSLVSLIWVLYFADLISAPSK